jgi:hypothetical protein
MIQTQERFFLRIDKEPPRVFERREKKKVSHLELMDPLDNVRLLQGLLRHALQALLEPAPPLEAHHHAASFGLKEKTSIRWSHTKTFKKDTQDFLINFRKVHRKK